MVRIAQTLHLIAQTCVLVGLTAALVQCCLQLTNLGVERCRIVALEALVQLLDLRLETAVLSDLLLLGVESILQVANLIAQRLGIVLNQLVLESFDLFLELNVLADLLFLGIKCVLQVADLGVERFGVGARAAQNLDLLIERLDLLVERVDLILCLGRLGGFLDMQRIECGVELFDLALQRIFLLMHRGSLFGLCLCQLLAQLLGLAGQRLNAHLQGVHVGQSCLGLVTVTGQLVDLSIESCHLGIGLGAHAVMQIVCGVQLLFQPLDFGQEHGRVFIRTRTAHGVELVLHQAQLALAFGECFLLLLCLVFVLLALVAQLNGLIGHVQGCQYAGRKRRIANQFLSLCDLLICQGRDLFHVCFGFVRDQ